VTHEEFVPEGQKVNSSLYVGYRKIVEEHFPGGGGGDTMSSRRQFFIVARKCCFPFRTGSEDISGEATHTILLISYRRIFLFPKVNTALKGKKFQDAVDIKKNVTVELKAVPLEAFADCFQKLFERCNKYIQVGGDYFEYK
jgi:hypothetical protein